MVDACAPFNANETEECTCRHSLLQLVITPIVSLNTIVNIALLYYEMAALDVACVRNSILAIEITCDLFRGGSRKGGKGYNSK